MSKEEIRFGVACIGSFIVGVLVTIIIFVFIAKVGLKDIEETLVDHNCIKYNELTKEFYWVYNNDSGED